MFNALKKRMFGLFSVFLFNLIFASGSPCNAQMSVDELKEIFSGSKPVSEETGSDTKEIVLPVSIPENHRPLQRK